jgi:hypothetical protein
LRLVITAAAEGDPIEAFSFIAAEDPNAAIWMRGGFWSRPTACLIFLNLDGLFRAATVLLPSARPRFA